MKIAFYNPNSRLSVYTIVIFLPVVLGNEQVLNKIENTTEGNIDITFCRKTKDGKITGENVDMNNSASLYNYGLCLKNNDELNSSLKIFANLINNVSREDSHFFFTDENGFMTDSRKPTRGMVAGQLLVIYYKSNFMSKVEDLLKTEREVLIRPHTLESQKIILESLYLSSPVIEKYYVIFMHDGVIMRKNISGHNRKTFRFFGGFCNQNARFPPDLQELEFSLVQIVDDEGLEIKDFDIGNLLVGNISSLRLICPISDKRNDYNFDIAPQISWGQMKNVDNLEIVCCRVLLNRVKISPKEIVLDDVVFIDSNGPVKLSTDFYVDKYINFNRIENMSLIKEYEGKNVILNMTKPVKLDELKLIGERVKIINWEEAKWEIKALKIKDFSFLNQNILKVEKMMFCNSEIDISVIPGSVQAMSIDANHFCLLEGSGNSNVLCNKTPNLLLKLKSIELKDLLNSCFSNPSKFPNLSQMIIGDQSNSIINVTLENIPDSVSHLILRQKKPATVFVQAIGNVITDLNQLSLFTFSVEEVLQIAQNFKAKYMDIKIYTYSDRIVELIKQPYYDEISICGPKMEENDFKNSLISKYVDKNSSCYIFRNGTGKAVEISIKQVRI